MDKERKECFILSVIIIGIGLLLSNIILLANTDIPDTRYINIDKSTISIGPSIKQLCLNNACNNTYIPLILDDITVLGSPILQLGQNVILQLDNNNQLTIYNTLTDTYYFKGILNNNSLIISANPTSYLLGIFQGYSTINLNEYTSVYNVQFTLLDNIPRYGMCIVSMYYELCMLNNGPVVLTPSLVTQTQLTTEWDNAVITPYQAYPATLYGTKCLPYLLSSISNIVIGITSYQHAIGYITPGTVDYQLSLINGTNQCISTSLIPNFPSDTSFICFPYSNCKINQQSNMAYIEWWGSNTNNITMDTAITS